jgi:hypothetical protein
MPEGRRGPGRKPVHIDLVELEKLCALQCTDEEIADWFDVSTRTIESRRKQPGGRPLRLGSSRVGCGGLSQTSSCGPTPGASNRSSAQTGASGQYGLAHSELC